MRLYSTLAAGEGRAPAAAGPDPHVLLRPDRLRARRTSATRGRSSSACGSGAGSASAATTSRSSTTSRTSTTRSTTPRPGKSAELAERATQWYLEDTGDLGLGQPDELPQGDRARPGDRPLHRGARRRRLRVPGRRRRLLPDRLVSRLRRALRPARHRGRAQPVRGGGAERAEGGSARLRALEGAQGGRGHVVGLALGARPAGLAHRVLGDGRGAARPGRSRSTAAGSTSSSRTTRTSWPSRALWGTTSRRSGRTTACSASPARRCPSRSATSSRSARRSTTWGRETVLLFFLTAHWSKPIDFSEETMAQAAAQVETLPRTSCATRAEDGDSGTSWPRRSTTTSTRRTRSRSCTTGATATCSSVRSSSSGSTRSRSEERRRRRSSSSPSSASRRARGARLPRVRPAARRDRRARLGGPRRGRAASGSCASSDDATSSTGAVPCARRCAGAGRCSRCTRRERALAAESWLRDEPAPRLRVEPERALTALAGTADHQGVVARVEPYPYADADELARAPDPLLVCLDQVTDPRNLGAVARSAEGAGATGIVAPGAPVGTRDAGRLRGRRPERSSTCRLRSFPTWRATSPR